MFSVSNCLTILKLFFHVFRAQHCLLLMLKNGKKSTVDNKKVFGALLTDLSNTFHCIIYDLPISKLNDHGLSFSGSKLIHDYLLN